MYKDMGGVAGDGAGVAGMVWNPFAGQEGVTAMAVGLWRRRREPEKGKGQACTGVAVAAVELRGTGPPLQRSDG